MRADYLTRFKNQDHVELADKVTAVRLQRDIDAAVRSLPSIKRSEWLRRVISEAATRELMND